jgi:hypothetical protein
MSITYRLRPEVDTDGFLGGVLAVPGGDIDVKKALDDGNGLIVIDDHEHGKAVVLDDYPPLERVADAESATSATQPPETVRDLLQAVGITPPEPQAPPTGEPSASPDPTSSRPVRESSTSTTKER